LKIFKNAPGGSKEKIQIKEINEPLKFQFKVLSEWFQNPVDKPIIRIMMTSPIGTK